MKGSDLEPLCPKLSNGKRPEKHKNWPKVCIFGKPASKPPKNP